MIVHPLILITVMVLCSCAGGLAFKVFSENRDVLMLVAGFGIFSISNVAYILTIDQTGLARAMVIAATAQMIITALAAFFLFGERIGLAGWISVGLACLAVVAASFDVQPRSEPSHSKSTEINQEANHV